MQKIPLLTFLILLSSIANIAGGKNKLYRAIAENDSKRALDLLQKKRVNPNGRRNCIPLMIAPNTTMADLLINYGAYINQQDTTGFTPLHRAIQTGNVNMVAHYLKNGAQPNVKTHAGNTALHRVCLAANINIQWNFENLMIAKMLLEYNATTWLCNISDETPLDIARKRKCSMLIALLEEHEHQENFYQKRRHLTLAERITKLSDITFRFKKFF